MRVSLIIVSLLALLLAVACGSAGQPAADQPPATTDTPRSERAYRQASIMQQDQPAAPASEQSQADDEQPATPSVSEQTDTQPEQRVDTDADASSGTIDYGHRFGLPFTRNVVGDPDAPVLIVEYSDYQ